MGAKERKDAANEVKVLSSLKHPYIVAYKDSFIEDGFLNIVMEYADGGDLFTRIQKAKKSMTKFAEQQILRWFTQALLALKFIHDKHILHRDLKSQNFFLMSNGKLKIGDFGIAKVLDNTAACAQTTIGTPYYLSPQDRRLRHCQGAGQHGGVRADDHRHAVLPVAGRSATSALPRCWTTRRRARRRPSARRTTCRR